MIEKNIPVTNNKLLGRFTRLPPKYIYITPIVSQTRITCIQCLRKFFKKSEETSCIFEAIKSVRIITQLPFTFLITGQTLKPPYFKNFKNTGTTYDSDELIFTF